MSTRHRDIRAQRCQKAEQRWQWIGPLTLDGEEGQEEEGEEVEAPITEPDGRTQIGPLDVAGRN